MSKKVNLALLTLAAFFILGFPIAANAGKPPRLNVVTSPPLPGFWFTCHALNQTDDSISARFDFFANNNLNQMDPVSGGILVNPGRTGWYAADPEEWMLGYCTLSWEGARDDFKATICAYDEAFIFSQTSCLSFE